MFRKLGLVTTTLIAMAAVLIAVSGSSAASQRRAASASAVQAGITRAEQVVKRYEKAPKPIDLPSLSKRPPTGKSIVFIGCPLPECQFPSIQQAAKLLGWHVRTIVATITPEGLNSAWESAAALKPDAIIAFQTIPWAALSRGEKAIESAHIPLVTIAGDHTPGQNLIASEASAAETGRRHGAISLLADWITVDSKGTGNSVFVDTPGNEAFALILKDFQAETAENCPDCHVSTLNVSLLDIGEKLDSAVVSYLQSNPSVDYVVMPLGAETAGLSGALRTAGLSSRVKIVSRAAGPANQVAVGDGQESATIGEEVDEIGWRAMDALARHFVGDSLRPCCTQPISAMQLLTSANIKSLGNLNKQWVTTPDLSQRFARWWKVKS
jgi:ribose transport system substrate-binding protein